MNSNHELFDECVDTLEVLSSQVHNHLLSVYGEDYHANLTEISKTDDIAKLKKVFEVFDDLDFTDL